MERFAKIHYLFISKEVEVVGTDKHEYFLVERLNPSQVMVTVHKRKKDGELEQVIYQRTFQADETKEIRLYGLDGEDVFEIKGEATSQIKVRIIGGDNDDEIEASSSGGKSILVYDTKETNLKGTGSVKSKLSNKPGVKFLQSNRI